MPVDKKTTLILFALQQKCVGESSIIDTQEISGTVAVRVWNLGKDSTQIAGKGNFFKLLREFMSAILSANLNTAGRP